VNKNERALRALSIAADKSAQILTFRRPYRLNFCPFAKVFVLSKTT